LIHLILDKQPELEPADEQPNYYLVHPDRFRKTNGFSHQALDPRAYGKMLPFQLSRSPLADHMLVWI